MSIEKSPLNLKSRKSYVKNFVKLNVAEKYGFGYHVILLYKRAFGIISRDKFIKETNMKIDVFISYSSKDKMVADAICSGLEQSKIRCWMAPRDIVPGQVYGEAIVAGINACKIALLVYSANSNSSTHVLREIERAVSHEKIIVPFRIENVKMSDAMEYFLSAPHWLDAITPPLEQNISKLIIQLYKILGIEMDENFQPIIKIKKEKNKLFPTIITICIIAVIGLVAFFYINQKETSQKIKYEAVSVVENEVPNVSVPLQDSPEIEKKESIIYREKQLIEQIPPTKEAPPVEKTTPAVKKIDNTILNMAIAEYTGSGGTINLDKAGELFKNADKSGNTLAKMWTALLYFDGQCNFEKSAVNASTIANSVVSEVEKYANEGDNNATYLMGVAYKKGLGVGKNDEKAVEWLTKSVDKKNVLAMHLLGIMYTDGQYIQKDDKKAVALLKQAAEKGNVISMYYMGLMLKTGRGIQKDDKQSVLWFKKAAQKGHAKSMYILGSLYEKGVGIPKDHLEALQWWEKAAKKGNKNAQNQLKAWNKTW